MAFVLTGLLLFGGRIFAQQGGWANDTLSGGYGDTLWLSHPHIVPLTVSLNLPGGAAIPDQYWEVDYTRAGVILSNPAIRNNTWIVKYRYVDAGPRRTLAYRRYDAASTVVPGDTVPFLPIGASNAEDPRFFLNESRIRKTGSISRGLVVGNNRGLGVTSGLRLQLEGDLGDGWEIMGALTDDNIPVQPDGTTQQLNDFDRVFIRLRKNPIALTLGDYETQRKNTRFANYYRNVQGVQLAYKKPRTYAEASLSVARGRFHTNSFDGQDGVSGPYPLTGANGERYFIVLAGSERVYLNGKLMQRGENADYVINYNTAEVTFTPKHVITNITRIVVDFEYSDRNYNRSLITSRVEQKLANDKLEISIQYARDADNPNAPFSDPEAYDEIRDSLALVGDVEGPVFTSGVRNLGYEENTTRYARNDTVIGGTNYERYVFSTDSATAIYGVSFTYVGPNQGYYRQDNTGRNLQVFVWVPPDDQGNPRGDFAPLRRWVLPKLLQVVDATVSYQINEHLRVYNETALSINDRNRLSAIDDADNTGVATHTGLALERLPLGKNLHIGANFSYQYVDSTYTNLDRVYQAEYNRVWDLETTNERVDEQIASAGFALEWRNVAAIRSEVGMRLAGTTGRTLRQAHTLTLYKGLRGWYTLTHITNENQATGRNGTWWRHNGDLYVPIGRFRLGTEIWLEDKTELRNELTHKGTFAFTDLKPYFRTNPEDELQLDVSFNYRRDREYFKNVYREKSEAYTGYARIGWRPSAVFNILATSAYRQLEVRDTAFISQGLANSQAINTNLQTTLSPVNRLVYLNLLYEVNTEQLSRKEIRFVQVAPGQGQYVWLDSLFNNDGIQDVSEFQLATNPLVADFIRVVVPSRELFPTVRNAFSGTMRWAFRQVVKPGRGFFSEFLRNLQLITTFNISQSKARDQGLGTYLVDIFQPFADSTLLDANYTIRQEVSFWRNHPKGEFRVAWFDNQSKLFLNTGDELRGLNYVSLRPRVNFGRTRSLETELRRGTNFTSAPENPERNFNIAFWEVMPKMNFQLSRQLRLSTGYSYINRQNRSPSEIEQAVVNIHKAIFESRWNIKDRNNLMARLELIGMTREGSPNFAAGYQLQEGLLPGFNAIWQVFTTIYLLRNVELSLTYDGRSSPDVPVIHTGKVQVRAFF